MRDVPASIGTAWRDGNFIGTSRAIARATVQHPQMSHRRFSLLSHFRWGTVKATSGLPAHTEQIFDPKHGQKISQTYNDFLFTVPTGAHPNIPTELPNIKSVQWNRSINQDVADCTIEIWNTKPLPIGTAPDPGQLDLPGYYTYSRGGSIFSRSRWGYARNEWFGLLVPDNIIRTFEGYGCDPDVIPELDPYLVQTGVWMIDSVDMSDTGTMSIKCRDIGRLLLDQYYYEPVVPQKWFDDDWTPWDPTKHTTYGRLKAKATDSSNTPWIGAGNAVNGHKLSYAFDGNPNTYWLSIGNDKPSRRFAYEWVQCSVNTQTIGSVKLRTKKKGYTCYISVKVGGVWQGTNTIDYHRDGIGENGGNIKYVATTPITTEGWVTITLKKPVAKVQAVRVTLGNLQDFGPMGSHPYHYRAGIRDIQINAGAATSTTTKLSGAAGANPGKYNDYSDVVKLLCAWGGFYWPADAQLLDSHGTRHDITPGKSDVAALGLGVTGRIWGDFQLAGTTGTDPLGQANFDKKPLMDGIAYVREILGFLFFIDETGGVQWRMPNIFWLGNWKTTLSAAPGRTSYIHPIDERTVLLSLNATIDSKNVRETIAVGAATGKIGAWAPGFNPNPTGMMRLAAWTDQNFASVAECQRMADMISLAQMFTYRSDKVKIPANPAIQIDDQVRIVERTTAEGYVHYVTGISSSLDLQTGEWTYDLDTHWLGYDPSSVWVFNPGQLYRTTQDYIATLKDPANSPVLGPVRTDWSS